MKRHQKINRVTSVGENFSVSEIAKAFAALWAGGAVGIIVIALWCAVAFAAVLASSVGVYLLWDFGRWLIG